MFYTKNTRSMTLKDRALSERNLYAAIYALPNIVNEVGLLSQEDLLLYADIRQRKYIAHENLIAECRDTLKRALDDDNKVSLFSVSIYFQLKKVNEDGSLEYRPIHTADIKTLICLQALANVVFFDDDLDKGTRQINAVCKLVPNNFYGNLLSTDVEYVYKNWVDQYKGYVQTAIDKHRKYAKTKEYTHEAYLDVKNFFPNINPNVLYEKLLRRFPECEDKKYLARILQLLLYFKIDGGLNEQERALYYGKSVSSTGSLYTKGLPQGLPHCAFFANWMMMDVANVVDKNLKGDKVYYVDDITVFCNDDEKALKEKVSQINQELSEISQDSYSPLDEVNAFFKDNIIVFNIQLHDNEKCCSYPIGQENTSIGNLMILNRKTSGVMQNIKIGLGDNVDKSSLSLIECFLIAIDKERELIGDDNGQGLYKKRLDSFYKFYVNRKVQLMERLGIVKSNTQIKSLNDDSIGFINGGRFRQKYRDFAVCKLKDWEKVRDVVKRIDIKYTESAGIDVKHLYFLKDCEGYRAYRDLEENISFYYCLDKEVGCILRDWELSRWSSQEDWNKLFKEFEEYISSNECRRFIRLSSQEYQRVLLLAIYSKILHVSLSNIDSYLTTHFQQLSWNEVRILHYLKQPGFSYNQFKTFVTSVLEHDIWGNGDFEIDSSIVKVLPLLRKTVKGHQKNDELIQAHLLVYSLWKNGSKFLHFFTLHNVEHSIALIEKSVEIARTFAMYDLTSYDYYLLFMSCYFHDITLVSYPDVNDFHATMVDVPLEENTDKQYVNAYCEVDRYFEQLIRGNHAKDSANAINKRSMFNFLNETTRNLVSNIAFSHGDDAVNVYDAPSKLMQELEMLQGKKITKGDLDNTCILDYVVSDVHIKYLKSIIRLADSLDMNQDRVSPVYLREVMDNIPDVSRFHWISHLAVKQVSLESTYSVVKKPSNGSFLSPKAMNESVVLNVALNTCNRMLAPSPLPVLCKGINAKFVKSDCVVDVEGKQCETNGCPFVCQWMHHKNSYLAQELVNIRNMSNQIEYSNFTTSIRINYLLAQSNGNVDDYLPFVEEWLKKQNTKVSETKENLQEQIKSFEKLLMRVDSVYSELNKIDAKSKDDSMQVFVCKEMIHDLFTEFTTLCKTLNRQPSIILEMFRERFSDIELMFFFQNFFQTNKDEVKNLIDVYKRLLKLFHFLESKISDN